MIAEKLDNLEKLVGEKFPSLTIEKELEALVLRVSPDQLIETMTQLRDGPGLDFTMMIDLAGVHYPDRKEPFEVVYQLLSVKKNHRIRIKVSVDEETPVPSIISVWGCADWFEREAYDMFGIRFSGHPDLRRLLSEYDFEGHPLRKDFPLSGKIEMRYDEKLGRVVREPIDMSRNPREPFKRKDREPYPQTP
ncbi:MAG: NADH-quinone oxidoreductase subunit C [Magnetococcales bacterium]|nr:NADH-quinone oxidoreductase subunit C [Magnetococcales bacterium]